ncbi:hypothetical protein ASD37_26450 [Mycobacterium sp. Root135]|nr:hypothetical protein ASD37_26450 [Mycobacterium sp. Root135]
MAMDVATRGIRKGRMVDFVAWQQHSSDRPSAAGLPVIAQSRRSAMRWVASDGRPLVNRTGESDSER